MIYFDPLEDFKVHNVKGMYMQSLVDDKPLLSSYPGEWWAAYRTDHQHYDRLFKKMFASWYPMDQIKGDDISEVTNDFRADVYSWLLANDKRYSEIYRINVIDDTSYDLLNNYDMTETYSGTRSGSGSRVKGSETDTENNSYVHGAQSKSGSDQMVYGATSKSGSDQMAYGATSESGSDSTQYGSKTTATDSTTIKGQHEDISINAKSAFNETTMQNTDKNDTTYGSETDTLDQDVVEGAHTDTTTISRSALAHTDIRTTSESETTHTDTRTTSESETTHTDTRTTSESETAHTDTESKSATFGSRTDTETTSGSEGHTMHRVGNIGVQTATDMMDKANTFWGLFEFYTFIMKEIARELLRGC